MVSLLIRESFTNVIPHVSRVVIQRLVTNIKLVSPALVDTPIMLENVLLALINLHCLAKKLMQHTR